MAPTSSRPGRRAASRRNGVRGTPVHPPGEISPLTINRISVYLRSLRQLEAQGVTRISSQQLARRFHLSSTQIRKDLALFGGFGVRGVGYDVARLAQQLTTLLHLDRIQRIVIVGMGNIGTALARFPAFNSGTFRVVAGFDADPARIGREIGPVRILPMEDLETVVEATGARLAVLAVPAEAAVPVFRAIAAAGIPSVLNFAPVTLPPVPGCRVKHVDLRIHLEELVFFAAASATARSGEGV